MRLKLFCLAVLISVLFSAHLVQSADQTFFTKALRRGSTDEEVRVLQLILKQIPEVYPEGIISGIFGRLTEAAVKRFQTKYNIEPVGFLGPRTRAALNKVAGRLTIKEEQAGPPPPNTKPVVTPTVTSTTVGTQDVYFSYSWKANTSLTGEINLPKPAPRPVIVLNGKPILTLDTSAAVRLATIYKIVLADTDEPWDDFHASMLLEMLRRLPETRHKRWENKPWEVSLTSKLLTDDISVTDYSPDAPIWRAKFSKAAFVRSNPTLQPSADSNPDRVFYSNRLFRATLKAFFSERPLLEDILTKRYGVKTGFADPVDEFQEFNLEELQYVISVFEELPSGFRNIPGFEKIVRRKHGLTNPIYPGAPAIAWVNAGYVEFMDGAFTSGSAEYIRRLVAHEITHFLWHKVLTNSTKQDFMRLSGWSTTKTLDAKDASLVVATDHPKSITTKPATEKWYRTTTTNFVSDYAAVWNPDEDFAETVAYYVYEPDKVRTIAPDKYNFIKNVVSGYEYVILVDQQFTFQVFNLEPDTTFPGKIVGVDMQISRLVNGDSRVVVDLSLSSKYGDGAERALSRIFSSIGTYVDVYFYPHEGDKFRLRGEFTITKYAAKGYWAPEQITVSDRVDNRRYEGQNQFGWLMYIDNPEEDLETPLADLNNIRGEITTENGEQVVKVYVPVTDKNEAAGLGGLATMPHYQSGQEAFNYAIHDLAKRQLIYVFSIRKYKASGTYTFREFWVWDIAGNQNRYDLKDKALTFNVATVNPDYKKPELDISSIRIKAVPTKPQAPDGETDVTIWYNARDDNAGLGNISYILLKPTGDILFDYHYHDNFYTDYFVGVPSVWKTYQIDLRLPPGSPPGTWILQEIVLKDKAGNTLTNNFVETGILRPFEVK